jgi:hypothetical protein
MEVVWDFYGPWLRLLAQIGLPLLLLSTPAMFLFKRGSSLRRMIGKVALLGWALVLLSVMQYSINFILQDMAASMPGT